MKTPPRHLHRGHFAFMRALAQGLDERTSWDRYLRLEGEHTELRTVRRTIAWIRDAFAAAARREHKPGTARLILLDPDRFDPSPARPSLAEFAQASGLEEFSEAEQIEAYEEAFPDSGRAGQGSRHALSRRARVMARQLEALDWLQRLVARDPHPGDHVAGWLHPALAQRLERAGVSTLAALVERINERGARWWVQIPGVGERKAERVLEWLQANQEVLGLRVGAHGLQPRRRLTPATLAAVVPPATAMRPLEKFLVPDALDGRAGRFRAPVDRCLLTAVNDQEAMGAWLRAVGGETRAGDIPGTLSSTQRAYRKEAERLLLWSILERRTALSSLSVRDAADYAAFLTDPPPAWCGQRHHQRWSTQWRPLEGPLAPAALRRALVVARGLFAFLVEHGYLIGNPFASIAMPARSWQQLASGRTFSHAQWDCIDALLNDQADTEAGRRLRRAMRWLYATGLRLAEIASVRCEDLLRSMHDVHDDTSAPMWRVTVTGTGGRTRQVPVPGALVEEFADELARHGFDRQVDAASNRGIHLLSRFDTAGDRPIAWSPSGVYQAIKAFMAQAAEGLDGADAEPMRKASTHWLRHTHGTHALQGRAGRTSTPLEVVQSNLGHASSATTSMYLRSEQERG